MSIWLVPIFEQRWNNGGMAIGVAFAAGEVIMLAAAVWILPRHTIGRAMLFDCGRAIVAGGATLAFVRLLPAMPFPLSVLVCVVAFGVLVLGVRLMRTGEIVQFVASLRQRPPR
jgi:hypothetical protein